MNTIAEALHPQLIEAFGWTLIHSIWQGTLIALSIAIVLAFISKKKSQIRYGITLSGLILMVGWSGYTFYQALAPVENGTFEASVVMMDFADETIESVLTSPATWISKMESIPLFIEPYLPGIMMIWLMGYLFFSLRWAGSLYYLHRLKTRDVFPLEYAWQLQMKKLSKRMGLQSPISLLESSRIQTPMVIGYFKPAILLPAGLLTGISPQQLEAILAHELAHIIRKDFLVNMVLAFGETLFFYHPAYWWMSHQISIEREHCCDDVAISFCGDPFIYAKTLTNLAEMKITPPSLSLAMTGSRGSLLERIQRILQPQQTVAGFPAKAFLSFLFLLGLTSTAWLTPVQGNHPSKVKPSEQFYPGISFYLQAPEETPNSIPEPTEPSIHEIQVEEPQGITEIDWQVAPLSFAMVDSPTPDLAVPPMPVLPELPEMPQMPEFSVEIREQPEQFEFQMKAFESQMESWEKSFQSIMSLHEKELGLWKESFESFQNDLSNTQKATLELEEQLAKLQHLKSLQDLKHALANEQENLSRDREQAQADKIRMLQMKEQLALQNEMARLELEKKKRHEDRERSILDQNRAQAERQRMNMEIARKKEELARRQSEAHKRDLEKELRYRERQERLRNTGSIKPERKYESVKRELKKDGLLDKDPNRLHIKKSPHSLKINGHKLSPELEKKYRSLLKRWGFNLGDKSSFTMTLN